ncbi:hypothetical protein [Flaviflagellibacter deserti]|uniref:DoxX-like protein n=1 Tax=Flaviflagellibacter deserti TaxID=2267266 RepID=A0ABV9Z520_9HYPH
MIRSTTAWRPSKSSALILVVVGALSLSLALYTRYWIIEPSAVGLACQAGAKTLTCFYRGGVIFLFEYLVLGSIAVAAAAITLARPSVLGFAIALAFGLYGVVVQNTQLSALALALLPLVFARPARATKPQPG